MAMIHFGNLGGDSSFRALEAIEVAVATKEDMSAITGNSGVPFMIENSSGCWGSFFLNSTFQGRNIGAL
jgi:hypothetical protein